MIEPDNEAMLESIYQSIASNDLFSAKHLLISYITEKPSSVRGNEMLAYVEASLGNNLEAIHRYRIAIEGSQNDGYLHAQLGTVLLQLEMHEDAVGEFQLAIMCGEDYPEIFHDLLHSLIILGHIEKAKKINDEFACRHPNSPLTYKIAARLSLEEGDTDRALKNYDRALELEPRSASIWLDRASLLLEMGNIDSAIDSCDKTLALDPNCHKALFNKGVAYIKKQDTDKAILMFERVVASDPNHIESKLNLGLLKLEKLELAEGWKNYGMRWASAECDSWRFESEKPVWDGKRKDGTLLVWGEQGVGDQIFFCSMLTDLLKLHANTILAIEQRLIKLIKRKFPRLQIIPMPTKGLDFSFDYHIALGDLGSIFRKELGDFSKTVSPWMLADLDLSRKFRDEFSKNVQLICGVSWASPLSPNSAKKSIQINNLLPIFSLEKFRFLDLQYLPDCAVRDAFLSEHNLNMVCTDHIDKKNDLDALAALINACDIIVTISNTTAHLAGALGKKCFLIAPSLGARFWYWHSKSGVSTWYPSVKVFHKFDSSDIESQILAIKFQLSEMDSGKN